MKHIEEFFDNNEHTMKEYKKAYQLMDTLFNKHIKCIKDFTSLIKITEKQFNLLDKYSSDLNDAIFGRYRIYIWFSTNKTDKLYWLGFDYVREGN